jgi:valyl-tRNA synthetase
MTGKLPFHTVYLHGLVRDEQGRKMSKSLGNVVDPLGVIGDVGCDALRFTLATGTSPGQDLNLSLERLKSNRNFTNKVWNAGKFVLFAMEDLSDDERVEIQKMSETIVSSDTSSLSLSERWIISKLHQTVDQVTKSLDKYDFGIAGRSAYGFFYDDFADWFIESIKTKFNDKEDPEGKKRALAVTLYACDSILRLLHPFVPYVTEEIWQALPHSGDLLISQSWPETEQKKDDAAEQSYETLRSVVTKIRNARAEYNVEPAKKIENCTIVIKDSSALLSDLQSEVAVLCSLARLDPASTTVASSAPVDCEQNPSDYVNAIVADGVEVFLSLAGLADPAKESKRLKKQAEKLEKDLNGLNGRLSSEAFLSKARPDVVEKAQAEAKELSEQLAAVQARLKVMTGLLATSK